MHGAGNTATAPWTLAALWPCEPCWCKTALSVMSMWQGCDTEPQVGAQNKEPLSARFYLLNVSRLTVQGAVLGKPPAQGCGLGLPWGPTQDTLGCDQCHTYRCFFLKGFTHVAGPSGSWAQSVPLGPCQHPDSPMLPQVPCAGDLSWASPSYGLSPTHGTATPTSRSGKQRRERALSVRLGLVSG